MARAKRKLSQREQSDRFIETARRLGTDESTEHFEEKLRRIASVKPAHKPKQPKKRA